MRASLRRTSSAACPEGMKISAPARRTALAVLIGTVAVWLLTPPAALEGQEPSLQDKEGQAADRAKLFIALLRRRAERILEARRAPPPPLLSLFASAGYGYESNVNLDGSREGDSFTEQSGGINFRPRLRPWLEGELSYDFLADEFHTLTDSNLQSHTGKAILRVEPHRRIQLEVAGEAALLYFPRDEDNTFLDQRLRTQLSWAHLSWLTHRVGWLFQYREYDTRRARDPDQVKLNGLGREDRRHVASYEMRLRFPKTFARLAAEFYRNFSNDHFQDFYDWEDFRFRGSLTRVLGSRWIASVNASHERKNYQSRSVPVIAVAERDNLLTVAGSLIYQLNEKASLSYSLTYRYQDSNDPRLDFTDWVHQAGVTLSF